MDFKGKNRNGYLVVFCCLFPVTLDVKDPQWESFKVEYNRSYLNQDDETHRKNIFMDNLTEINRHNLRYQVGYFTFTLGINRFADMTVREFSSLMNSYKRPFGAKHRGSQTSYQSHPKTTAIYVDWRDSGCVTEVKDQGNCGSCWSFSAIGSAEFYNCYKTGKGLTALSEQNLIDCTYGEYGNFGCEGGWMDPAFQYIIDNPGVDTEETYPYEEEGVIPNCRFEPANVGGTLSGYTNLPHGNESALADACAANGVISVAVDASNFSFQFYRSGIYYEPGCGSDYLHLNHAVLLVGFGNDFWLVKNSWGKDWGLDGYILMVRNHGNNCGIASAATYPTL